MKPKFQRPKQITSQELRDDLLRFVEQKFYPGEAVEFAKDHSRLLQWVILWPASWLNQRGVTLPADRYREIFTKVFMQAVQLGATDKIRYRPAYMKMVIQSHFKIHGEEYYAEAKSARSLAEHALLSVGKVNVAAPDPVREMAKANGLLAASKTRRKASVKAPSNDQLKLI